jgi:hypothetical protein
MMDGDFFDETPDTWQSEDQAMQWSAEEKARRLNPEYQPDDPPTPYTPCVVCQAPTPEECSCDDGPIDEQGRSFWCFDCGKHIDDCQCAAHDYDDGLDGPQGHEPEDLYEHDGEFR